MHVEPDGRLSDARRHPAAVAEARRSWSQLGNASGSDFGALPLTATSPDQTSERQRSRGSAVPVPQMIFGRQLEDGM